MDDQKEPTQPPPKDGDAYVVKMVWLCAAFFPSAIGIACLHFKNPFRWLFPLILTLNLIFSVAASIGLVRGMRSAASKFILGFFLILFFFVLNALIVLFIGCSGMGRIAP